MEFEVGNRAVYLPTADAVVCADLHVGKDDTSNVEMRLGEHEDVTGRFEALLDRFEPTAVVIAGDLLHSFQTLSRGASETIETLCDIVDAADCRLVVTPGNHDVLLDQLWDGQMADEHRLPGTEIVVTHGHELPDTHADLYVVGHDHPTIEIEGQRRPCLLYDTDHYENASVLMLPAFSRLPAGVAVNRMHTRDFQSPFIRDADALRPVVYDQSADQSHTFPPLGKFRRLL